MGTPVGTPAGTDGAVLLFLPVCGACAFVARREPDCLVHVAVRQKSAPQPPGVRVLRVRYPARDARLRLLQGQGAGLQPVAEAAHVVFRQPPPAVGEQDVAEEGGRLRRGRHIRLARMQREPAPGEVHADAPAPLRQHRGAVMEQGEVVHVAQVPQRAQDFLHEVVQAVEVDVGEELAGQVADGQPPAALEGGEQVVAGVVEMHRLLGVGAVDDRVDEPQGACAPDAPAHVRLQHRVVDGWEVAVEVATQHRRVAVAEALVAGHRPVRALAEAVGVAVEDEAALEDGLDDRAQRMVHHPVPERGGGDRARLGVADGDFHIAPRPPRAREQLAFEAQDLRFQIGEKGCHAGLPPLAPCRALRRRLQGRERGDARKEAVNRTRHGAPASNRPPAGPPRRGAARRAHSGSRFRIRLSPLIPRAAPPRVQLPARQPCPSVS